MMVSICRDFISGYMCKACRERYAFVANGAFYSAFALYVALSWINLTVFNLTEPTFGGIVEGVIQLFVLALLAVAFLFRLARVRRQLFCAALVLLGFIVWRVSGEGWLFWTYLFIACAPEFDRIKLSKIVLVVILAVLFASTVAVLLGIFPMEIRVRSDNGTVRYALGFLHPNNLGLALTVLAISFCILRYDSFKSLYVFVYLLVAAFVCLVPVSRTSAVLIVLTLLLWVFSIRLKDVEPGLRNAFVVVLFVAFFAALLVSLLFIFAYDELGALTGFMNKLLSGRPYFAKQYFDESGIRLLGYSFPDGPVFVSDGVTAVFLVDNAYDHVLLRYGIISFALLFGAVTIQYRNMLNRADRLSLLCGVTVFMLMALTEAFACRVECNYLLISLAFIFERNELVRPPISPRTSE